VVRPVASGTSDSPSDEAVLESAAEQDRVLVTTDTDLLAVHTRWITHGKSHPGIVIGQQDQNLKRFLRNLRYTLKRVGARGTAGSGDLDREGRVARTGTMGEIRR
jgi:predicted nuclease of predicted toxin-antitoxin system